MNKDCRQITPLLAGYALEALELEESLQVEAHISNCASCRSELEDFQTVSTGLMRTVPPIQPPARLRAGILAKTETNPERKGGVSGWKTFFSRPTALAGAAVVLLIAVMNITLLQRTKQMMEDYQLLLQQNRASQTAFSLMAYPESQVVVINDQQIYGTLIYDPQGQFAVLNVWGLDPLSENEDYQVWLIEPDQTRVSGGVFQPMVDLEYTVFVIESPVPLKSFTRIGVTVEPAGGSPGPTGPRVLGTEL